MSHRKFGAGRRAMIALMIGIDTIIAACARHGAARVHEALYRAMSGDRGELHAVGLGMLDSFAALNRASALAYAAMSRAEQEATYRHVIAELDDVARAFEHRAH